ncbi:MAG: type II toxin-antitoxin system RelE/ParE family toxin [Flavobacteriales bacterium]
MRFKTEELKRLYTTPLQDIKGKFPFGRDIIKQYKKKVLLLISVSKLKQLKQFKGLKFEYLKGKRKGECSIRLNKQYRLIFKPIDGINKEIIVINEISKHYE